MLKFIIILNKFVLALQVIELSIQFSIHCTTYSKLDVIFK
jgi:hypothetical protein